MAGGSSQGNDIQALSQLLQGLSSQGGGMQNNYGSPSQYTPAGPPPMFQPQGMPQGMPPGPPPGMQLGHTQFQGGPDVGGPYASGNFGFDNSGSDGGGEGAPTQMQSPLSATSSTADSALQGSQGQQGGWNGQQSGWNGQQGGQGNRPPMLSDFRQRQGMQIQGNPTSQFVGGGQQTPGTAAPAQQNQ